MLFKVSIVIATFFLMEPIAYLAHRLIMHGFGWILHASHHQTRLKKIEANDAYPVAFAAFTIAAIALGTTTSKFSILVPVGIGITIYGAAYAFMHDIYIHKRLFNVPTISFLEPLRYAHQIHHLYNGEPYGMLFPIVPKSVRARADAVLANNRANGYSELLPWGNTHTTPKYIEVD
ncbi:MULTISPECIES: sterol desaturase family protein [Acidithrix]|uniref:Fatty acid hydroxylase superfamily protein n=1 Tax=Acidithrix ferrooxidans TaxID=1280514 RepID=A0A0D8HGB8_9ACTN|nr:MULTISPECIES: sterol desaturase family protein [Acidithrix]KJF17030.1 fatty acid hydroxylase superfamily protein [Acidithrix ferrooxidans]